MKLPLSVGQKLHRFRGGIRPPAHKEQSLRSVIMDTPIPETLFHSLRQFNGIEVLPVVAVGDIVLKGQLLAESSRELSVPVHASSSGKVTAICPHPVIDEFGGYAKTIKIETDGKDRWIDLQPRDDIDNIEPRSLLELIQAAGISGLGGAGYPTARKFASNCTIKTLIINAAECEPYISADQALLRECADEVVSGATILQRACKAEQCIIAIEANKQNAIKALQSSLQGSAVKLIIIPDIYPSGSEKQLIQIVTGQQVPAGKLPEDLGLLMANAGTANAIHNAVIKGEPLISRITTVCGDTLKTPKNFRTLIGTPAAYLFELCGIDYSRLSRVIAGGSLMGISFDDLQAPVMKTSNCLIAGSSVEFPEPEPELACIRCGFCSAACPAQLMPQQLYDHIRSDRLDKAQKSGLNDCIECGACAYVCPSKIPLVQYYRFAKSELQMQASKQLQSEKWQERYRARQARLAQNAMRKQGSGRRSLSQPDTADTVDAALTDFSRDQARQEIANAVARVKAKRNTPVRPPKNDADSGEGI